MRWSWSNSELSFLTVTYKVLDTRNHYEGQTGTFDSEKFIHCFFFPSELTRIHLEAAQQVEVRNRNRIINPIMLH